jgi:hypothetical protein
MKDREAKLFVNYIDILIESSPKTGIKKTSKSLGINFKPIGLRDIAYTEYDSTCSEKCATIQSNPNTSSTKYNCYKCTVTGRCG